MYMLHVSYSNLQQIKRSFVAFRHTGDLAFFQKRTKFCLTNTMSAHLKAESETMLSKCFFPAALCFTLGHARKLSNLLHWSRRRLSTLLNDILTVFEAEVSLTAFTQLFPRGPLIQTTQLDLHDYH